MNSIRDKFTVIKILKDHPPLSPILKSVEFNHRPMVLKDYATRSVFVKDTWGRFLINNESQILNHLKGIKGIPQFITKLDDYSFLMEYLEGDPLARFKTGELPYETYLKLTDLVRQVHERGVIHLDLGQRRNILIDKDFKPYLVDFANALYIRRHIACFNSIFKLLSRIDYRGLLKVKNRWFPGSLTAEEKSFLKKNYFLRKLWFFKPKKYRVKDIVQ